MRYYLELLIKAKGMLETVGHVFLQDSIKNDQNKEIYGHIYEAFKHLEEETSSLKQDEEVAEEVTPRS
jgi:hypothetical protein